MKNTLVWILTLYKAPYQTSCRARPRRMIRLQYKSGHSKILEHGINGKCYRKQSKCTRRHAVDHRSYTYNLSSSEIKARFRPECFWVSLISSIYDLSCIHLQSKRIVKTYLRISQHCQYPSEREPSMLKKHVQTWTLGWVSVHSSSCPAVRPTDGVFLGFFFFKKSVRISID